MSDPKIRYDIEAAVKGEQSVEALAGKLRELDDVLEGDLQQSAQASARDLDALGSKQRAVEQFTALKRETEGLSKALGQAATVVDRLGPELQEAAAKTQTFGAAQKASKDALTEAQASLQRKREALKTLSAETASAARKTDEYRATQAGLKTAIAQATAEVKTRRTELQAAQQTSKLAVSAELALGAEYDKSVKAASRLSLELGNKNRALAATRETLQAAGVGTRNLAQAQASLQTAVSQVRERVAALAPAYQQAAAASSASTQTQASNQRTLREGLTSISAQLQRVQQIATVALGGSYIGGMARSVAATADEFQNLQARVKLASGEGDAFTQAWDGVTRTALETNSALEETGTLFARLHKASREGGASAQQAQDEALALTRTINQAMQLSGGSAASSQAALTQLIQGLQSGVLRGEEFNSVMEQSPRLAQALADGLGVTTGALRAMAQNGELSAAVVMKALRDQAATVETEFAKLPPTVGRALQNLSTQWTMYIGQSDKGLVSSANAAKALNLLAENLDTVVTSLTAVGKVWAASRIASLAADFGGWVQKTLAATVALEANTAATAANATAQTGMAAAQARVAQAQTAATAATVANTAAKAANASAWASISTFVGQAATATDKATAATVAGTAAVGQKSAALGLLGRAASGVTALLGGPVGLAVTTLMFAGEIKRGIVAMTEWAASFTDAGKKLREFEEHERNAALAAQAAAKGRAALAREQQLAADKALGLTAASKTLVAAFDELARKGESVGDALAKVSKELKLGDITGIKNAVTALAALETQGKITGEQLRTALQGALDGKDLAVFEVQARAALAGTADEGRKLQAVLDTIADESLKRAGTSAAELSTGFSAALNTAIGDTDKLAKTLAGMGASAAQAGALLAKSVGKEIEAAKTEKAIAAVTQRLIEMGQRGELSAEQVATGLDTLRRKADDLAPGIQSLDEALRSFGLKTRDELMQTAERLRSSYQVIAQSATTSLSDKAKAFAQYRDAAVAANGGVESSEVKLQASILETQSKVAGLGDAFESAMGRAADATKRAAEEQQRLKDAIAYGPGVTDGSGLGGFRDHRQTADAPTRADTTPTQQDTIVKQGGFGQGSYGLGGYALDTTVRKGTDAQGNPIYGLYNEGRGETASLAKARAGGGAFGGANTASFREQARASSMTVNINLAGRAVQVQAKDRADADRIVRELESALRAAGV